MIDNEDIIRMAIDAGATGCANPDKWGILEISYENLERFANLVAAHEREKPVQVSPLEFVTAVLEKEHLVGKPIMWAQWPNEEKK
jgi:hypothetical protein